MPDETGRPHFLCDAMLGRLVRWLRLLGYDARDTRLVRRPDVGPHCFIRHDRVQEQLRQLAAAFNLGAARAGTRCLRCNVALEDLPRDAAAGRVPPHVWRTHQQFARCPSCARIYWPGTHWDRMTEELSAVGHQPSAAEGAAR